jgi:hypothetical protein
MRDFLSYAMFPWGGYVVLRQPRISAKVRWFSLTLFSLSICIVVFYAGTCSLTERIFAIQIFYSAMAMTAKETDRLSSNPVRAWATRMNGIAVALFLTFGIFCFKGFEQLLQWLLVGSQPQGYMLLLNGIIFTLFTVNWWFVTQETSQRNDNR